MKIEGIKSEKLPDIVLEIIHNNQSCMYAVCSTEIQKQVSPFLLYNIRKVIKDHVKNGLVKKVTRVKESGGYSGKGYYLTDKGMELFNGYYGEKWVMPEY